MSTGTSTEISTKDTLYGSVKASEQSSDEDNMLTLFNAFDQIILPGYVKSVSISFYSAPSSTGTTRLYVYVISPTSRTSGFCITAKYTVPHGTITDQVVTPQTFLVPAYLLNVTTGQYVGVGFGPNSGSSYLVYRHLFYTGLYSLPVSTTDIVTFMDDIYGGSAFTFIVTSLANATPTGNHFPSIVLPSIQNHFLVNSSTGNITTYGVSSYTTRDDKDQDYIAFNYIDRCEVTGYVQNVSFYFCIAPTGRNQSKIVLYLIDDNYPIDGYPWMFNITSPYQISVNLIENKTGLQQFQIAPYALNITAGQWLAVSFSGDTSGSTCRSERNVYGITLEDYQASENPYNNENELAGGMAFSFTVVSILA
ncbi:unnamed protein product, partial [Didymodactylos carnosus]